MTYPSPRRYATKKLAGFDEPVGRRGEPTPSSGSRRMVPPDATVAVGTAAVADGAAGDPRPGRAISRYAPTLSAITTPATDTSALGRGARQTADSAFGQRTGCETGRDAGRSSEGGFGLDAGREPGRL